MNERELTARRQSRETKELKEMVISREKKELERRLVELLPRVERFNLWASELGKNLEGRVAIEYQPLTTIHQATEFVSSARVPITVNVSNFDEGRIYKWPLEVFNQRFQFAQEMFESFLATGSVIKVIPGSLTQFDDKRRDPFWNPRDYQPFAVGCLSLEPLLYALDFEGEVALVQGGKIVAHLDVILEPEMRKTRERQPSAENKIQDPRRLLEQDL
jgi:hypothetical protein